MRPRQFFVAISSFVIIVSSFNFLIAFQPSQPRIDILNLYSVTPKVGQPGAFVHRQSLKYTDPNGRVRIIHTISEAEAAWYRTFLNPTLSPKGNFVATNYTTYEGSDHPSIFRVSDTIDLVKGVNLNFDVRTGLVWSPDERFFAIAGYYEEFGGTGRPGLFISYAPFTRISPIMEFSTSQAAAGTSISNLELVDNRLLFTLVLTDPNCDPYRPPYSCPASPPQLYSFTPTP